MPRADALRPRAVRRSASCVVAVDPRRQLGVLARQRHDPDDVEDGQRERRSAPPARAAGGRRARCRTGGSRGWCAALGHLLRCGPGPGRPPRHALAQQHADGGRERVEQLRAGARCGRAVRRPARKSSGSTGLPRRSSSCGGAARPARRRAATRRPARRARSRRRPADPRDTSPSGGRGRPDRRSPPAPRLRKKIRSSPRTTASVA